jgi:DNA topoisomerase I
MSVPTKGYTLVVCEKPDAARRMAEALSDGNHSSVPSEAATAFAFERNGESYVVCSALGHLYEVSDPFGERAVYPVFDVEWFQRDLVEKEARALGRRISSIRRLADGARRFVNACDFDAEGETIGFNVLRYACGKKETSAYRARFSTLAKGDLVSSIEAASPTTEGLASAGRARHVVDFVWGVNLSRALTQSVQRGPGQRFWTVSMGRVQGPTLDFVVGREKEIRSFVPIPYWRVAGVFDFHREKVNAEYSVERIRERNLAEKVKDECSGKEGVVEDVTRDSHEVAPPPPFNLGDLQREAYRRFGFVPSRTLRIAERLYLDALISYPRTGSQKLPPSIDYRKIMRGIGAMDEYSNLVEELIRGNLRPAEGPRNDAAHPAIHPTGERPRRRLGSDELKLYDLVVRGFLAAFAPPAKKKSVTVSISVGPHRFGARGVKTVDEGWIRFYGGRDRRLDFELPPVRSGDRLRVVAVESMEKFEEPPSRYNQSSLLERMEKEGIGTKATRAETISTLVARGYVAGESLVATDLGFSVDETMNRHAGRIVTTSLTRQIEERLEKIESGAEDHKELIRETIRELSLLLISLNADEEALGNELREAAGTGGPADNVLGGCPVCKTGKLMVIRSRSSHKRFVGCSNYRQGCRASAPLPQRGGVRGTAKPCQQCGWPMVYLGSGRRNWKQCVNVGCPTRRGVRKS